MITVTDTAREEILELMKKQEQPVRGVRIKAEALSPLQANFRLRFVAEDQVEDPQPGVGIPIYVE